MYKANDNIATALALDGRTFRARMTFGDGTVIDDDIVTFTLQQQANSNTECLDFGGAVAAQLNIEILKSNYSVQDKEFFLEIGIFTDYDNDLIEYVPMGYFIAQKPTISGERMSFTAFDRMAGAVMTSLYVTDLDYPCDIKDVLDEIEQKTGYIINNKPSGIIIPQLVKGEELESIEYSTPFDGYTFQEAFGMLAGRILGFATFNRLGNIELRKYSDSKGLEELTNESGDILTDGDGENLLYSDGNVQIIKAENIYLDGLEQQTDNFILSYLSCSNDSIVMQSGDGDTGASVVCNFITQDELDELFEKANGITFTPMTVNFRGDFRFDLGDLLCVEIESGVFTNVPVQSILYSFDGGLTTQVGAYGSTGQSDSNYVSPTEKAISRVYQKMAIVEQLIATKRITVGDIIDLEVGSKNYISNSKTLADYEFTQIES